VTFGDVLGIAGSLLIVIAYFGAQKGWLAVTDWRFPLLNLIGSVLILLSLFAAWNLGAFVMEVFWILISLYGLFLWWRRPIP
jgi:hypothetical protein